MDRWVSWKRDSCGTQHYAQSPHTNTINNLCSCMVLFLHKHLESCIQRNSVKDLGSCGKSSLSQESFCRSGKKPLATCPRGKNHRLFGILRGAHRSSALTLRKLKFLHLSYLEECSIEIPYEYFSYTMTDISFHSSIWLKNTKTLN